MTKVTNACVFLDIEVHDPKQLKMAAAARAVEEGISLEDWKESRTGLGDDLRMLLDPGSIPGAGFTIVDSNCETN